MVLSLVPHIAIHDAITRKNGNGEVPRVVGQGTPSGFGNEYVRAGQSFGRFSRHDNARKNNSLLLALGAGVKTKGTGDQQKH